MPSPNRHVYCIGDCGGAMEEAKCPEFKSTIGGTNHALHPTNSLAGHMDDAISMVIIFFF